jgi:hypothetical protein
MLSAVTARATGSTATLALVQGFNDSAAVRPSTASSTKHSLVFAYVIYLYSVCGLRAMVALQAPVLS